MRVLNIPPILGREGGTSVVSRRKSESQQACGSEAVSGGSANLAVRTIRGTLEPTSLVRR